MEVNQMEEVAVELEEVVVVAAQGHLLQQWTEACLVLVYSA